MSQTLGYRPNPTPEPRPQKEVDLLRRAQILDAHTKAAAEAKDRERIRQSTPFELMTRPIAPDDYHFVLNAWMKSYRDSKRLMRNETYFVGQQNLIAEIAKRRNCIVGCDSSMPKWIAGFAAGQMLTDGRLLLDYVYVKSPYRSRGIGLQLIGALGWSEGTPIVATHSTKCADKIARKYEVTYDEYFNAIGYSDV